MPYTGVNEFLQAVFGSDFGSRAAFATDDGKKQHKKAKWKTYRKLSDLSDQLGCYWSIAAFPDDGICERTAARAIEVRALLVDDIKPDQARWVRAMLGTPTAIVRTSTDNYQWIYRLSTPVAERDWNAFFRSVIAYIGVGDPDSCTSIQWARLPMGLNLKWDRAREKVELIELNLEATPLDPATIPMVVMPRGEAESTFDPDQLTYEEAAELMDMHPNNDLNRNEYVNVSQRLKARCPEGELIWEKWAAKSKKHGTKGTGAKWSGLRADATNGWLLNEAAQAAEPERYAVWLDKWQKRRGLNAVVVFDDGLVAPDPFGVSKPKPAPHMLLSGEFLDRFVSPDYLVRKVLTKSFLYSLTGMTGAGKTSVTLRLAATVAQGMNFGGLDTKRCQVLYMAAENPVDIQMRWFALAAEMGFDARSIQVVFIEGHFTISTSAKKLREEAERIGGEFGLVIVDTGPVFFEGADENDRTAMRQHARMMRGLIDVIPGKPAVVVNMHPTKSATIDRLEPSGGGSFLNEVDGNLTCAKNAIDQSIELHWFGKWRGVEFAPLSFILKTVTHPRLVDSGGEFMPTVVCAPLSQGEKEAMEQTEFDDQSKILAEMVRNPNASYTDIAKHMGWFYPLSGKPYKSKAQKVIDKMIKDKLVKKHLRLWVVGGTSKSKLNGHAVPSGTADEVRSGANAY